MKLKSPLSMLVIVLLMSCPSRAEKPSAGTGEEAREVPSKDDIRRMIPDLVDGPMEGSDRRNIQTLISYGSAILPQLAELIEEQAAADVEPRTRIRISRLLGIARRINGKHDPILNVCRRRLVEHPDPDIRRYAAKYVGAVGTTNECSILLPLLTDDNERVRVNAIRALAELGDQHTLERIETFLANKHAKLSKEHQEKDYSVREARKAIETIKDRLAKAKEAREQDKTDP